MMATLGLSQLRAAASADGQAAGSGATAAALLPFAVIWLLVDVQGGLLFASSRYRPDVLKWHVGLEDDRRKVREDARWTTRFDAEAGMRRDPELYWNLPNGPAFVETTKTAARESWQKRIARSKQG